MLKTMLSQLFLYFVVNPCLFVEATVREVTAITMNVILNLRFFEDHDTFGGVPLKYIAFAIVFPSCTIPVIVFIIFGITSLIITFTGFLFIEGTLLVFGGLCTCACIIALLLVFSALTLMLGVVCTLALKLNYVLKSFSPTSNILQALAPSTSNGHVTELTHAPQN